MRPTDRPTRLLARSVAAFVATAALGLPAVVLAPAAHAVPVKCAAGDPSPDGRIFPEPNVSVSLVRFTEFECGIRLLEQTFPDLVQVTELGRSKGNVPVYDVLLTDRRVTTPKRKLLVVSSIHGNEPGGREGALRVMEDWVDPTVPHSQATQDYVTRGLSEFVVHFVFPNPDGWVAGDVVGGGTYATGIQATRGNASGTDLNRNFPVQGWISAANKTLQEPESQALDATLFQQGGWYLGTDNHGQGADTYGAAGLQIVGQFDFQKSETLARYADAITDAFAETDVLNQAQAIGAASGADAGAYHWGTLYDMLGYSASGSLIDYYNTADGLDGTGYATELTAGQHVNEVVSGKQLVQVWVDSIRAINNTMLKQALVEQRFVFPVGSRAAYVDDPAVVTDADGEGYVRKAGETLPQLPYSVSRMQFFRDLNEAASRPLDALRVPDVIADPTLLDGYDALVLADAAMPEGTDDAAWFGALTDWVSAGGTLIVTDAAAPALERLGLVPAGDVRTTKQYVGYVDFADRTQPLNQGLRGVASQTYDTVPIGYAFGSGNQAPNWTVSSAAWQAGGGTTAGTQGSGRTIYGEKPLGAGTVRFLGALLPQPTEAFYHPYGLQSYAVTYTGYTLLENMLDTGADPDPVVPEAPAAVLLPLVALVLGAGVVLRRRRA